MDPGEEATGKSSLVKVISDNDKLLITEARSLRHLMTHLPKNRFCPHCQRAKITSRPARSRHAAADDDPPKQFGDRVLVDTMIAKSEESRGIDD